MASAPQVPRTEQQPLTGGHADALHGHKQCVQPRNRVESCIWVLWSLGYSRTETGHRRPRTKEKTNQKDQELAGTKRGLIWNIPPFCTAPTFSSGLGSPQKLCWVPVRGLVSTVHSRPCSMV
ncbi:hypothetical protein HJG60_010578 [Phyllostomus discolor]|uniref:Uncharacterized protein n=1 Tax=Phyllostomus discolor TaxID=89673 RepID=A0A834AP14_9CHIR|nr:hypothetical protein HJG60_010578 [Phyllostomus discolor]